MKSLIIICLIVLGAAAVLAAEVDDAEWEAFKTEHKKSYDAKEDSKRRSLYKASKERVEEHNKKHEAGESSFTTGINEFSDWTEEELKKLRGRRQRRDIGLEFEWEEYKKKYGKHYETEENARRKEIYLRKKLDIDEHNDNFEAGKVAYKQSITSLTDQTDEEIKQGEPAERKKRAPARFSVPEGASFEEEWAAYKTHFKKEYDAEEDTKRQELYKASKAKIEAHNAARTEHDITLGINQFADQTEEELKKSTGGLKRPKA